MHQRGKEFPNDERIGQIRDYCSNQYSINYYRKHNERNRATTF